MYREEAEEGMRLEKADAFFRNWGGGCPFAYPLCPSQPSRDPRAFPSLAAERCAVELC